MVTLGIDPGYARLGWSILEHEKREIRSYDYGIIETPNDEALYTRLLTIHFGLTKLIKKYQPSQLAIEDLFFSKNEKTALLVAQARGVILLCAAQSKLSIFSYNPLYVKQTLCGNGHANKKQIQTMVKLTLKLKEVPEPDDVADAIALAITHAMSYTLVHKHD